MRLKLSKIRTSPDNQTRTVMYDPTHVDAIVMSLQGVENPEKVLPKILVEPLMGSEYYNIVDGHHRHAALLALGCTHVDVEVIQENDPIAKAIIGFENNCTDKPKAVAGMAELEVTLSKLHAEGVDIKDPKLHDEFRKMLHHKTCSQVARVAKKITTPVMPVKVVCADLLDHQRSVHEDTYTAVNHSQSTKWQQGLGYLLEQMVTEDKPNGILLIYFADGLKKKRFNKSHVESVIEQINPNILIEYLN